MSGVRGAWVWQKPVWRLRVRGLDLADIELSRYGYTVRLHDGEIAGPYGDLAIARQSVARRIERSLM